MRTIAALAVVALPLAGCDFVMNASSLAQAAKQVSQHLEQDLRAPLTDEKVTRVVAILPELQAFQAEAKTKWKPEPGQADVQQLASAMGALSEYLAFFEARDTRLTEFWVDFMKIADVRAQVHWEQARQQSLAKLQAEREALEAKPTRTPAEERQLAQTTKAIEKLEQAKLATPGAAAAGAPGQPATQPKGKPPYTLSPEEVALVKARLPEVDAAFAAGGYGAKPAQAGGGEEEPAGAPR